MSEPKPNSKCAFCEATPVQKVYPAAPALIGRSNVFLLICDTEWEACVTCAGCIDQNRWEDLAEHVTEAWSKDFRADGVFIGFEERERLKRIILHLHAAIREAMGRTA